MKSGIKEKSKFSFLFNFRLDPEAFDNLKIIYDDDNTDLPSEKTSDVLDQFKSDEHHKPVLDLDKEINNGAKEIKISNGI